MYLRSVIIRQVRSCGAWNHRSVRYCSTGGNETILEKLTCRGVLRISGRDMYDFLQGLITNDIQQLSTVGQSSIYTMFLNAKGRVLYDAIIYKGHENEELFIECDSRGQDSLEKHMKMFRIRKKVDITSHGDFGSWVLYNPKGQTFDPKEQVLDKDLIATTDPRLPALGLRILGPKDSDLKDKLKESFILGDGGFKQFRYRLGVAEGTEELPPGECLPLEVNCDLLKGVSFNKGCYIGQELTARTYHTGIVRKRIMPVQFGETPGSADVPLVGAAIRFEDATKEDEKRQPVGKLRALCGNAGLALFRVSEALSGKNLKLGSHFVTALKPSWWPEKSPKKSEII